MTVEDVWIEQRPRLIGLAYRILGSWHEAEDVVSQAWMRLAQQSDVRRPEAWLTTVTTRLAIDEARRARSRREEYVGPWLPEPVATDRLPEEIAETRSLLGLALLRLMETLDPEERAIYVLREAFDVAYGEIAECVGRSPAACRQVVSRARTRLSGAETPSDGEVDRRLLTALAAAVTAGDVAASVRLVSGDCVLWTDGGGVTKSALHPIRGADKVIRFLVGVSRGATADGSAFLDVNGLPALWFESPAGPRLVVLERDGERVTGIQVHGNPAKLGLVRPDAWRPSPAT